MSLKINDREITNPMRGDVPINFIYRGETLLWSRGAVQPPVDGNTFIGGLATELPDKASLAEKLTTTTYPITASNISYFEITGSDIAATINVDFWIPPNAFRLNNNITYFRNTSRCIAIQGRGFEDCINLDHAHFHSCAIVWNSAFVRNYKCKQIYLPICTEFAAGAAGFTIADINDLRFLYAPLLKIMTTAGNNNNCRLLYGNKIYVHPDLSTINSGNPDGDLVEALSNGMQVIYGTNQDILTKPNEFSVSNIGVKCATAIQLIDDGTSSNAIDYFKVYLDGVLHGNVKAGNFIVGLNPETSYNITAEAVDEFNNKASGILVEASTVSIANSPYPTIGLKSIYQFENSLGNILDSFGINHGTNHGVARVQIGKIGKGILLNNTLSNRISIPDSEDFSFKDGVNEVSGSISFWFNSSDLSLNQMIINKLNTQREWFVYLVGGKIRFQLEGNGSMYGETGAIFSNNEWYHCAITYDGSKSVNGINISIDAVTQTITRVNSSYNGTINGGDPVVIGNHGNQTSNIGFKGMLDTISFYKGHVLSSAEKTTMYNEGNGITL